MTTNTEIYKVECQTTYSSIIVVLCENCLKDIMEKCKIISKKQCFNVKCCFCKRNKDEE